ncbi:MAG TPA: ABC transporter ATP-binding protein [Actinomycetota bacterium]
MIEARGLRKRYGHIEAVRGIDLSVEAGEVFALLGPNGAGKTTVVEILEGYRERTSGQVTVLGHDPAEFPREARELVGIVLQSTGVDPFLTVRETVDLYAGYYRRPRPVDEVIDLVGLAEQRDTRVIRLSGGQQRRLDVAVALAGDPELFFLDEPTTGFDPGARRNAWQIVRNLSALGKTVVLTTHSLDEAQELANRVAVLARGEVVAEGAPSTLAGRHLSESTIRFRLRAGAGALPTSFGAIRQRDGLVELVARDPVRTLRELTGWALARGVALEGLEVTRPTLEDVYLELTRAPEGDP